MGNINAFIKCPLFAAALESGLKGVVCVASDGTSKQSALLVKKSIVAALPGANASNMMFLTDNSEETLSHFADLDASQHPKFVSSSNLQEIQDFVYNN